MSCMPNRYAIHIKHIIVQYLAVYEKKHKIEQKTFGYICKKVLHSYCKENHYIFCTHTKIIMSY